MRIFKILIGILLINVGFVQTLVKAESQENSVSQDLVSTKLAPITYPLKLVYIFEEQKTEFLFVIGDVGFKSIDSLKKFIEKLPTGTTIEFQPTCKAQNDAPLSKDVEINNLKEFCKTHSINFTVRPSG